jgi:UDP-hydrolysing UDP-N-acetyl-D-glucosamine 2-epimerase
MKTIAVLTTGRQDWGILHSTAAAIRAHDDLELRLIVGGTHLSARHGRTIDDVRADGFEPDVVLSWPGGDDASMDPPAVTQAATTLDAVGAALRQAPPDALVLVGDRLETAGAALAATLERVPIIHLHGGEQTLGAFDDALRHAITKLSHLHLVSHEEHARRVIAMGEDPTSVHVVGPPGLDAAFRDDLPSRAELARELGLKLDPPLVVVTVHPTTLEHDPSAAATAVTAAMDDVEATYVVTLPNADPGGDAVRELLEAAAARPGRVAVDALGERRYWGLLRIADAMLGNSSSALIEAPAVDLPAVDVGDRQGGRRAGPNVLHAPADPRAVTAAFREALDPATRKRVAAARPALADGRAGQRIADIIAAWRPPKPPRKPPITVPG